MGITRAVLRCLVLTLACPTAASARELPTVKIHNPQANEQYSRGSSFTVSGELSRPLGLSVEIDIFHIDSEGRPFRLLGVGGIRTLERGSFQIQVKPPAGGWPLGKIRIVASVEGLRQVVCERDLEVVKVMGELFQVVPHVFPASSGLVIDTQKALPNYRVATGKRFLVRGEFEYKHELPGEVGPTVMAQIRSNLNGVVYQSSSCRSLWDSDARKYWFEIELLAPNEPMDSQLIIKMPLIGSDGKMQRQERQFPLSVKEAAPLTEL